MTKAKKMDHIFDDEEFKSSYKNYSPLKINVPFVTLSYAQSLDGSISRHDGKRLLLSSKKSLIMTHLLRSKNQAILVGIGTILADDPFLTVRYVSGKNPRPVIIDSRLRIPLNANVLQHPEPPWIFSTENADFKKEKELIKLGAKIFKIPEQNKEINLQLVLKKLNQLGIKTLMVEGGRMIITSFIDKKLVNKIILTISPVFVGGFGAISREFNYKEGFPKLKNIKKRNIEKDLVIEGDIVNEVLD